MEQLNKFVINKELQKKYNDAVIKSKLLEPMIEIVDKAIGRPKLDEESKKINHIRSKQRQYEKQKKKRAIDAIERNFIKLDVSNQINQVLKLIKLISFD